LTCINERPAARAQPCRIRIREPAMFKDLLVATTGLGDDAAAVAVALALAEADAGHVAVLVQSQAPIPMMSPWGLPAVEAYVEACAAAHVAGEARCAQWRERLAKAGVGGEVRQADNLLSSPPLTAAMHARYSDLAVLGRAAGTQPPLLHDEFARLLAGSGRPVLAVPAGHGGHIDGPAVIGWRPGPHAARAVHDALPLLRRASAVHVVCVDPVRAEDGHGEDPGADIARHLARHGLQVEVHSEPGAGDPAAVVLLRRCRELGAALLVLGGYGHSRMTEAVLGGTTRHVFAHAELPVLFSH
jgi:nucleotide-binding universal stress UspA family protein